MRHPHKRTGRLSHRARQKIERARRAEYEAIQAERALRAQQAYEVMCARLRGERPAGGPPGLPVEGLVIYGLLYALVMVGAWLLRREP